MYHITDKISAGLQFRSEIQAKLNGKAAFTGPAALLFNNTDFHTGIKLPPELVLGLSTTLIPRWTLNADIEWQGWRTLGSIQRHFDTTSGSFFPQQLLDQPGTRLWHNSYVYRFGAEFAATDRLALRGRRRKCAVDRACGTALARTNVGTRSRAEGIRSIRVPER